MCIFYAYTILRYWSKKKKWDNLMCKWPSYAPGHHPTPALKLTAIAYTLGLFCRVNKANKVLNSNHRFGWLTIFQGFEVWIKISVTRDVCVWRETRVSVHSSRPNSYPEGQKFAFTVLVENICSTHIPFQQLQMYSGATMVFVNHCGNKKT